MSLDRASGLPAARRRLVRWNEAIASGWDAKIGSDPRAPDEAAWARADARRFALADLYFVTPEMTGVALDASTDMPPWSARDILPSDHGMLIYGAGVLPPLKIHEAAGAVSLAGVLWTVRGSTIDVNLVSTGDFVGPALRWDETHEALGLGADQMPEAMLINGRPVISLVEPVDVDAKMWTTNTPDAPRDDQLRAAHPWERQVLSLLGATWTMMSTPTVAETSVWSERRSKAGAKRRKPALVTTIALRRLARKPADDERTDDPQRVYTHQWVVRGHWRQQAHGPGRTERRTTWVPSYIKGPEGAPLLRREHVHVWRR